MQKRKGEKCVYCGCGGYSCANVTPAYIGSPIPFLITYSLQLILEPLLKLKTRTFNILFIDCIILDLLKYI